MLEEDIDNELFQEGDLNTFTGKFRLIYKESGDLPNRSGSNGANAKGTENKNSHNIDDESEEGYEELEEGEEEINEGDVVEEDLNTSENNINKTQEEKTLPTFLSEKEDIDADDNKNFKKSENEVDEFKDGFESGKEAEIVDLQSANKTEIKMDDVMESKEEKNDSLLFFNNTKNNIIIESYKEDPTEKSENNELEFSDDFTDQKADESKSDIILENLVASNSSNEGDHILLPIKQPEKDINILPHYKPCTKKEKKEKLKIEDNSKDIIETFEENTFEDKLSESDSKHMEEELVFSKSIIRI